MEPVARRTTVWSGRCSKDSPVEGLNSQLHQYSLSLDALQSGAASMRRGVQLTALDTVFIARVSITKLSSKNLTGTPLAALLHGFLWKPLPPYFCWPLFYFIFFIFLLRHFGALWVQMAPWFPRLSFEVPFSSPGMFLGTICMPLWVPWTPFWVSFGVLWAPGGGPRERCITVFQKPHDAAFDQGGIKATIWRLGSRVDNGAVVYLAP